MGFEKPQRFDAEKGKPDALGDLGPELRAARGKAMMEGRLPEFDREHGINLNRKAVPEKRTDWGPEGKPWAKFMPEASQYKMHNPGDPRTIDQIAQSLMEGAGEQKEAA